MSRSIKKKGPFMCPIVIKRGKKLSKAGDKKVLKTWSKLTIFPSAVSHDRCS